VQWVYANKQAPWHAGDSGSNPLGSIFKNLLQRDFANILDRYCLDRINALSFKYFSQIPQDYLYFCRAFFDSSSDS
jgi:hypothetical protein